MMASEMPLRDGTLTSRRLGSTEINRLTRSGSGDSLLLKRRANRHYKQQHQQRSCPERGFAAYDQCSSSGNANLHGSHGSMSNFFQQQQRRALKKSTRAAAAAAAAAAGVSASSESAVDMKTSRSGDNLRDEGRSSRPSRSSQRLRNALGIHPKSKAATTTNTSTGGDDASYSDGSSHHRSSSSSRHNNTVSFGISRRTSNSNSHASAPSFLASNSRIKNNVSTGNLSTTSMSSQGSAGSLNLKGNAVLKVAQRSNGSTVKSVLARLRDIARVNNSVTPNIAALDSTEKDIAVLDSAVTSSPSLSSPKSDARQETTTTIRKGTQKKDNEEDGSSVSSTDRTEHLPPLAELTLLAQWASADAYYKVVISKYQGIPTMLQLMKLYTDVADLQAYCMVTLSQLTGRQVQIQDCGGIPIILQAMENHATNSEIMSQGFGLLKLQASGLVKEPRNQLKRLLYLVEQAHINTTKVYLTQIGKEGLAFCQQVLETYQIRAVASK